MTFEPLLHASIAIQIHVAAVIPAAVLGAYLLLKPKGTSRHRLLGKIWLSLMLVTALSSFISSAGSDFQDWFKSMYKAPADLSSKKVWTSLLY